jgi:cyclopropane fatty-acyl-phospholipid synthase-like methyltransferase
MPWISEYARRKKIRYFLQQIPKQDRILEVGCGDGWVRDYLRNGGWTNYLGLSVTPPADIVGDIRNWRQLGLSPESFDTIVAFEVVEHVDCFRECHELLRPGGRLMLTTPVPRMDKILKLLETLGLNQKRTSPHDHLVALRHVPYFARKDVRTVGFMAQWGILTKASS